MIKEKYDALISKLINATEKGGVVWEKTSSSNEFQAKLGDNAVSISHYDPDSFEAFIISSPRKSIPSYSLNIINSDGNIIDGDTKEKDEDGYDRLKTLFEEARRKYFRVDETIDDILGVLQDK